MPNASGSQHFRCRWCDRIYTPEPAINGYSDEARQQAVKLYRFKPPRRRSLIIN